MVIKEIKISEEYITLGQLLKLINVVATGGEVKFFLKENDVYINGKKCDKRGRKIYPGDLIELEDENISAEIKTVKITN
ncbi:S4 domain-containing protein YaaA [Natranaerofaba carboxydovora]|uniref:S4 domain-containing protein YaaA n=1 Tax=Natranaerofaba carboxydovora TaxID=2742683 RepID=UPI001F13F9A7|nr:S4 domain-containing protein YaaA [Natranaerofaba carboxydovora]UMZ75189.1 S4 domain protein [Natranaerofaba carboxydovora]